MKAACRRNDLVIVSYLERLLPWGSAQRASALASPAAPGRRRPGAGKARGGGTIGHRRCPHGPRFAILRNSRYSQRRSEDTRSAQSQSCFLVAEDTL